MSHAYKNLPIGTNAASVRAYQNLAYLQAKGVIPEQPATARVTLELANATLQKAERLQATQHTFAARILNHQAANTTWLNGRDANLPARPNRRMTPPATLSSIFMQDIKFNSGRK